MVSVLDERNGKCKMKQNRRENNNANRTVISFVSSLFFFYLVLFIGSIIPCEPNTSLFLFIKFHNNHLRKLLLNLKLDGLIIGFHFNACSSVRHFHRFQIRKNNVSRLIFNLFDYLVKNINQNIWQPLQCKCC